MAVPKIEGAVLLNEYDNKWHVRLTFKCPRCSRRHKTLVEGDMPTPETFLTECKNGGAVEVLPYR